MVKEMREGMITFAAATCASAASGSSIRFSNAKARSNCFTDDDLLPATLVTTLFFSFSFLGDGLRDAIDPHE